MVATLLAAAAALVIALPGSSGAAPAAMIDLTSSSSVVVESWQPGGIPNDPDRCVSVHFLQVPAVPGATAYSATVHNDVLNTNQFFATGPPYPHDNYTVSLGASLVHTFTAPGGSHRIVLGSDSSGSGCTTAARFGVVSVMAQVTNAPPTAAFTWSASPSDERTIEFDGSSSTDDKGINTYAWDFGDGATGSGQTASHSFAAGGTYPVTLTVTDDEGASGTATVQVGVAGNQPPVASFTWGESADDPFTIEFDGSGSTDDEGIDAYAWDFGDGQAGSGVAPPAHTYDEAGTYQVSLTVTDTAGATDTEIQDVNVAFCPVPSSTAAYTSGRTVARASTTLCPLIVTTNGDEPDPDLGDGRCDVDPDADGDQCTLRAAIQEANSPNRPDADAIFFEIAGSPEIVVAEPLPAIVGQATVDGSTQAGVTVDAGGGAGLVVEGSGSIIRQLSVVNAAPAGIELAGQGGHTLDGVLAGLTPDATPRANATGVWVRSDGNMLRGVVASGNSGVGVLVEGADNRLDQVVVGLTPDAAALAPNGVGGLLVKGNTNTVTEGVFTGNRGFQIGIDGEQNQLEGVIAGLSGDGSTAVPGQTRSAVGIAIAGGSHTVVAGAKVHAQEIGVLLGGGRSHQLQGSRITGASLAGVAISRSAVNRVTGNTIVDADGGLAGVLVSVAAEGAGTSSSDPQSTEDNLVQSNVIGATGIGNPTGVLVNGAARTTITGNWIAGNSGPGVSIVDRDGSPSGTVVQSNAIGLQFTGDYQPNAGPGVYVGGGTGSTIGGTGALDANLIAYNGGQGVLVAGAGTTRILGNQIVGNSRLGIETSAADAAAAPEILLVAGADADVRVRGASGSTHRVELFANDDCDPSGSGEGASFVGAATIVIGADGVGVGTIQLSAAVAPGRPVTATSTHDGGSTSQFSACKAVAASSALTAAAAAGATRLEVASSTGLVGSVVEIGSGASAERNYGAAAGSLLLAKKLRFGHAAGARVVALDDGLFVSVDRAVITRSTRLPDLAIVFGTLRAVAGRSIACGEDVTLRIDGGVVAQRLPGTRFVRQAGSRCVFVAKKESGVARLELDLARGTWNAEVVRRDLERLTNPVEVGLTIGDDSGGETLRFRETRAVWTYVR